MHARLERRLMAIMRKHGCDRPSPSAELRHPSGVLVQGIREGLYKWGRIVDAFVAERTMADGRTGLIPTIRFKAGHELGQPETMPIFDRDEAERTLAWMLGMIRHGFEQAARKHSLPEGEVQFRLFGMGCGLGKGAVEEARRIAEEKGEAPAKAASEAQALLASLCPMGMTPEMWDGLPEATRSVMFRLMCIMAAGQHYLLMETDPVWRSLHAAETRFPKN